MGSVIKKSIFVVVTLLLVGISGCKEKSFSTGYGGDTDGGGDLTPPPTATADEPLTLKLFTQYDNTSYYFPLEFDVYGYTSLATTQSTTCSATAADTEVDCTVTVPEGRLYRSSILFQFSRLQTQCKTLIFQPYFYRAGETDVFIPPGATDPISCASDPVADCWGGAAPELVPGFPDFFSLAYTADETTPATVLSDELTLPSAWSKSPRTNGSNLLSVNNMPPANVNLQDYDYIADFGGLGDSYVQDSYVDYTFYCLEDWSDEQPYTIHLYINEENEEAPGGTASPNDFWSWFDM